MVDQVELRSELLGLAERCEKATGRDDALALEIARATSEVINAAPIGADGRGVEHFPDFTGSLDAAMTLVPEGWGPALDNVDPDKMPFAELWHREVKHDSGGLPYQERTTGTAATLALAICAAALRARTPTTPERS